LLPVAVVPKMQLLTTNKLIDQQPQRRTRKNMTFVLWKPKTHIANKACHDDDPFVDDVQSPAALLSPSLKLLTDN
jgi:hypothetical protein